jgi:hypothetical protein
MHTYAKGAGFLIAINLLYLRNPDLFKRGIWLKTSFAQHTFSSEVYLDT